MKNHFYQTYFGHLVRPKKSEWDALTIELQNVALSFELVIDCFIKI